MKCKYGKLKHPIGRRVCKKRPSKRLVLKTSEYWFRQQGLGGLRRRRRVVCDAPSPGSGC